MNNNYMYNNSSNLYNQESGPVKKPLKRKIKPIYLIGISVLVVLLVFLTVFLLKNKFSSSKNWDSNNIKAVYIRDYYDLISLIGITDSGKQITIKEGNDSYLATYVYNEKLYYLDESFNVYSIDLTDESLFESKVFKTSIEEVWSMRVVNEYIFVIGDGVIESYNVSSASTKNININTDNNIAFSNDGLYIFYYNSSKNGIMKYNISSGSQSLITSNKLIVYGDNNKIIMQDDSDNLSDTRYFVYDVDKDEVNTTTANLNLGYPYKNGIIYAQDISLLELTENYEINLLHTFPNEEKIEGIANIVILGERVLIIALTEPTETTENGDFEFIYYLYDLNTNDIVKLNGDYDFVLW